MYAVLIPVPVPVAASTAAIAAVGPAHDPAGDADEAPPGAVLDHLAQQQPGRGHQPRPAPAAGPHRVAEDPREGGHVAGQAIDADQEGQAPGRARGPSAPRP